MYKQGRWYKDCRARRELNDLSKIPQHQMPPLSGIEFPDGGYGAPSLSEVFHVCVGEGDSLLPEVEGTAWEVAYFCIVGSAKAFPCTFVAPGLYRLRCLLHV